jgi:hypothetical protein
VLARQVTIHGSPKGIDRAVRVQEQVVVPVLQECDGFIAQVFLVDRSTGVVIGTSYWRDEPAMLASEAKVRPARGRVAAELGDAGSPDIRYFEVPVFVTAGGTA